MYRLLFFVVTFAFVGIGAVDARPLHWPQGALLVPAASGCGLGVHPDRFSRCYPVYHYLPGYWRGYRDDYYAGPVTGGVCGGRGTHVACDIFRICWVACNGRFAS
jgi:hypothetical protein